MRRHRSRIGLNLLLQQRHCRFELRIPSLVGGVRQVVHHLVRVHTVSLDQPFSLRPVDAEFGRARYAVVGLHVVE